MRALPVAVLVMSAATASSSCKASTPAPEPVTSPESTPDSTLKPVAAFLGITDPEARSVALFLEAGRVIAHPRCTNCHPSDNHPRQGMDQHVHIPAVSGGESGHGAPGLPCTSCHQAINTPTVGATLPSIPGNPKWALAPAEMAWLDQPLGHICEQLKDTKRNGGRSLASIQHHMAEDVLVGWGWNPGPGLQPVPGTQHTFGELIQAWIDSGAHCPKP